MKGDFYRDERIMFHHNTTCEPSNGYQLHCHAMYEVFYYMEGDVDYRVEGSEYLLAPQSLLLIAPNVFHGVKVNTNRPYHRASIHFLPEYLEETGRAVLTKAFHARRIYYPQTGPFHLEHYYRSLLESLDLPEGLREVAVHSRLTALLTQIAGMHAREEAQPVSRNRLVQSVLRYLNGNLRDSITLEQLSQQFYISKNHLNVLFRDATGTTVNQYLRVKRLALAQKEILEGAPAAKAAEAAGFGDYSNFYRAYKAHYGSAPTGPAIHRS